MSAEPYMFQAVQSIQLQKVQPLQFIAEVDGSNIQIVTGIPGRWQSHLYKFPAWDFLGAALPIEPQLQLVAVGTSTAFQVLSGHFISSSDALSWPLKSFRTRQMVHDCVMHFFH